jgi:hypothetical protein
VGILNNSDLYRNERIEQVTALIPDYKSSKEPASNNKFDFTLSEERVKEQALAKIPYYQDRALQTVREEAAKKGWSPKETEAYITQLKGSTEEMALTSLQYGGVKSPKASAALLEGDKATMRNEIHYRSNADKYPGLATRRRVEADMATGNPADWSKEEQAKWAAIENSSEAKVYRSKYPGVFGEKKISPAKGKENLQQMDDRLRNDPLFGKFYEKEAPSNEGDHGEKPSPAIEPSDTRANFIFGQDSAQSQSFAELAQIPGSPEAAYNSSPLNPMPDSGPGDSPEVKAFSARIGGETAATPQTLLLKDHKAWTEDERDMVMNSRFDLPWGHPTRDAMEKAITGWYENIYGTGNVKYDSTGRMINPQPITPIPKEPAPFAAKNGMDLGKAAKMIEEMILGQVGENNHLPGVVKNLQRGLNLTKPEEQEGLKLDGDYGPKTDFALKSTLAQKGTGKVKEALALGQIADHAEQAKYGQAESGLADFAKSTLGPLYPSGKEEAPNKVLQESLNDLGRQYKEDDWQDLKLDGWIGPKTEEAYSTIASLAEPNEIAASFGRSLRFI